MKTIVLAAALAAGALSSHAVVAADKPAPLRLGSMPAEVLLAKITVSDLDKSLDFYKRVIGLKEVNAGAAAPPRDPNAPFIEVGLNYSGSLRDAQLVLMRQKGVTPTRAAAELTWVAFKAPDVRAVMERVKAQGLEVKRDTMTTASGGVLGMARDPDGYVVELLQAPSVE